MGNQGEEKKSTNHICVGLLAHVDAGKTTLAEAMLYESGSIRRQGRVDNKDAFLDTHELERARGITIFMKQAVFCWKDMRVTLLDTPGHVDFSAEMERTIRVLDYAVLIISGADGIQGHTETLWRILKRYRVPVFVFFNKMDQSGTDKDMLMAQVQERFGDGCIDFSEEGTELFAESIAMSDENVLEYFLKEGTVKDDEICRLITERKIFPCFFGAALRSSGVSEFLDGIERFCGERKYPPDFGARVIKISRDENGNRLTHMKITGGSLKVRSMIGDEKVNQIRIYSGAKYESVQEAQAGVICAVTGIQKAAAGEGLGMEKENSVPLLEPVLRYRIELPDGCDAAQMLPRLRTLEEEEPELHIVYLEEFREIQVQIMGEVQLEVLKSLIAGRFGVEVSFGAGNIVYKETIADAVEGVGHFEPLRHYAEVHLMLEPLPAGSGLEIRSDCSEDMLAVNWQRLILTHLYEKEHKGVLTGSAITDLRITLKSGRAHLKHTEGGDFRQATYRAVRQGLKEADSVLLEPYYEFRLEVPEKLVGRVMNDMERMSGEFGAPELMGEMAVLTGIVPVFEIKDYQREVAAYSGGRGRLFLSFCGYRPCHNADFVIESFRYDSERDLENPTGSVFCAHGAGYTVSWDQVKEHMHLPSIFSRSHEVEKMRQAVPSGSSGERSIGVEEIDAILSRASGANKKEKGEPRRTHWSLRKREPSPENIPGDTGAYKRGKQNTDAREEYFLVDGYNVIYAWEELKALAKDNIDGARGRLLDILCDYQAMRRCCLIVVFDAYRVKGHKTEIMDYHNIHVVYTQEAETADQYIEKFAHENGRKYRVTVATSDGLEQIIIRGQGCALVSARELLEEIKQAKENALEAFSQKSPEGRNFPMRTVSEEMKKQMGVSGYQNQDSGI